MSWIRKITACLAALFLVLCAAPAGLAGDTPLYTAVTADACIFRAQPDGSAKIVGRAAKSEAITIYEVLPAWVLAEYQGKRGYVVRTQIHKVVPVDPVHTPPYGIFKHTYIAVTTDVTPVLKSREAGADAFVTLQAGAKLSILDITDGWARIPYWREYGYVDTRTLKDLTPVSPTDKPISQETPIAAFTSFYKVVETEANIGRMKNIQVACGRLSKVYEPGESLDFNAQIGPYKRSIGYFPAPVLIGGGSQLGYGGGTCQVSSTFYDTVMQLPGVTILMRRPHGPSGAKYLPHGVDAAVGNDYLNLRIRNDYGFPIRVEASAQDGALFMCIWKQ